MDLSGMKKILIVNSRSDDAKLAGFVMWGAWAVASYLKSSIPGSNVFFLDENNEDDFFEKFKKALVDRDTIGFSVCSMQIKYTLPLIEYVKKNYPHIRIMIGGIHPILFPSQDYGNLIDEVIDYELPKEYFDYELLPKKVKDVYRNKRAQVVTGFNCSFKCAFCVNSVRNCRYEGIPLDRIKADLDYVINEYNPGKIYFRDEDFFQDFEKAKALINYIIEKNYKFVWDTNSRVTSFIKGKIDDEFLDRMVRSGCTNLRFGVESGSQRMLNYLRKGQTLEQIKYAIKQCVKHDINASCSLIIGIPTETDEDREGTYKLIEELSSYGEKVTILGPQMFRPYPGGLIYEEIKKTGMKFPEKFEDWATFYDDAKNPVGNVFDTKVNYPWFSMKEKKTLPYVFMVAHYGLNWSKSRNPIKMIVGSWIKLHWNLRWFSGWDLSIFMYIRKKLLKAELE
jgi:radical SAM superfamily enzyme YgiQ (UPF0313 family)